MHIEEKNIYFIGIGGIGMSAIAKYLHNLNYKIAGYDAVRTTITENLEKKGINIHYSDNINKIPNTFLNKKNTLIIYTPAIKKLNELQHFRLNNFKILKRAQLLGIISEKLNSIGIAGTHGKTTISALTAHIFKVNKKLNAAFVGGILKNYNSNLITGNNKPKNATIIEADEFDRSFLNIHPNTALISTIDADHLDIYKQKENLEDAFIQFINQTKKKLIISDKIKINIKHKNTIKYGFSKKSNFYAKNIQILKNTQIFDIVTKNETCKNITLKMPGKINIENTTAAFAIAATYGIENNKIKQAIKTFNGIERRFDTIINNNKITFINDYAHHPTEIQKLHEAITEFYPNRKITAIFQPHLYSRTKDFATQFAKILSNFDKIILLDIYPAREKPIKNITSKTILEKIKNKNKKICSKQNIINEIKNTKIDILITIGAGDINNLVPKIKNILINTK